MVSGMNTASAVNSIGSKPQFTTATEMANALEGDYKIIWAGTVWDHDWDKHKDVEKDLFSRDVGAIVRVELFRSTYGYDMAGYIINDVPGSANSAVDLESIPDLEDWLNASYGQTTVPIFSFSAFLLGNAPGDLREDLNEDLYNNVRVHSMNNPAEGYPYAFISDFTYYELVGNQLNLYYIFYNKRTSTYEKIYFLKLSRIN